MAKERNALRTGIFLIVSVILAVFVIISISGAGWLTQRYQTYTASFSLGDDVGGLRIGDDVRIGGLRVGSVRDIRIDPASSSVLVSIDVPTKYPLGGDAGISIQKTLTGTASINIESMGSTPLAQGEMLHGKPDSLTALFRRVGQLEPDLQVIVANFKTASVKLNTGLDRFTLASDSFAETGFTATDAVRTLRTRLPEIFDRYDDLVASAVSALNAVRDFLGPSSTDFHTTVHNLARISGDLKQKLPDLLDRVRPILVKLDQAVDRATASMADLQTTLANTKDLTGSVRSLLVDNKSKLNTIIASLRSTGENLKSASMEIRYSPWRLLYQPKPGEVDNLTTYAAVRQFAEGAQSLDDAAGSLRDAAKDRNADPEKIKMLMNHLDDSFTKFQEVEGKLWQQIQAPK